MGSGYDTQMTSVLGNANLYTELSEEVETINTGKYIKEY